MLKYLIKRVLWMIPMLIGISLISFFIMHLAPGDITNNEAALIRKPVKSHAKNFVNYTI